MGIPLVHTKEVRTVKEYNLCPVVARCNVEIPGRHQILVSLRTQDRTTHDGVFESHKTPGGVLLKKAVVQPKRGGSFLVQAVNLNPQPVTLFKNQKIGTLSSFDEVLNNSSDCHSTTEQQPYISSVQTGSVDPFHELGVDLDQSTS